jgi:hypothetical protein
MREILVILFVNIRDHKGGQRALSLTAQERR